MVETNPPNKPVINDLDKEVCWSYLFMFFQFVVLSAQNKGLPAAGQANLGIQEIIKSENGLFFIRAAPW